MRTDLTDPPPQVAPFLTNLRRMLDDAPHILRWTPDGRALEIHNRDAMILHILPKYFNHNRYKSFQRQLNYFGFKKWPKAKASVCTFSNQYFTRDAPEAAWCISRKRPTTHEHRRRRRPSVTSSGDDSEPEEKQVADDDDEAAQWNRDLDWLLASMDETCAASHTELVWIH
ncbi:Aste57867_21364 [Aphanomyces stellatus]|uniref:Aste57867_21364 protein n=1 Tax=Aphanomyces stellatus TaxID=120398 RepID=A0A485LH98_9STRA|nr:hypothetical protein As57867_021295 [Aphanomyces stellatus]VFT98036.1 Aste57867_21364 [Aphanomyces stellatus]